MLRLLFDGDMLIYRACASTECDINWYGDLWTLHSDAAEAKDRIDGAVVYYTDMALAHLKYEGDYEIIMCLSDTKDNFRKHILPTYKAHRLGIRKPLAYYGVLEWVKENFTCVFAPSLEADDIMGVLGTQGVPSVIFSGDKDLKTIPCTLYDTIHEEWLEITKEAADRWHLYQTLVGDAADNYKGCPRIGDVGAKKILAKDTSWKAVVNCYLHAGLTEEDALIQARVAHILRDEDIICLKTGEFRLWSPPSPSK